MELIEYFIKEDWYLQSWRARYGSETWIVIAPQAGYLDQIREISTGGDIEATNITSYINNEGSWLPAIQAKNLTEGLELLNNKMAKYIEITDWRESVFNAFERIIEVSDGWQGLSIAVDDEKDPILVKPDWTRSNKHFGKA